MPETLGTALFNPADTTAPRWLVRRYYGGDIPSFRDPIAAQDKSGLGATLFQLGATGEKVLALRGTEPFVDSAVDLISADLGQIGILGLALTQVVSAVNLIQRMLAAPGANVEQIRINASVIPPSGDYLTVYGLPPMFLSFSKYTFSGAGSGELSDGSQITVTGHSLGGNVAYAISRLFPDLVKPEVYLYNAAGYDPATADFLVPVTLLGFPAIRGYLQREFGIVAAAGILPLANQLTNPALDLIVKSLRNGDARQGTPTVLNLRSEDIAPGDDFNIVASPLTGNNISHYPAPVEFPTESNNHVIEPSMDGLALLATVYQLNNTLTLPQLTRLMEVSSNQLAKTDERLTEALFKLLVPDRKFLGDRTELPISDATGGVGTSKGDLAARDAFFDAILRIQQVIKTKPGLQLISLADKTAAELISFAQDPEALAVRYALKELNPFAVIDTQNQGLYARFMPGGAEQGALDLYNPATRSGTITTEWIEDRSVFQRWKNLANTVDAPINADGITLYRTTDGSSPQQFIDLPQKIDLGVVLPGAGTAALNNARRYIFGGEGTDTVVGGNQADRLYGGASTDYMLGRGGNDYLEGGTGLDVYTYNGFAAFQRSLLDPIGGNDGDDVIRDTDGKGVLRYVWHDNPALKSTVIADASVKLQGVENTWRSADGKFKQAYKRGCGTHRTVSCEKLNYINKNKYLRDKNALQSAA